MHCRDSVAEPNAVSVAWNSRSLVIKARPAKTTVATQHSMAAQVENGVAALKCMHAPRQAEHVR